MSDENKTTNENNTSGESLSGEWKSVGKGLGKTFSGLGKTLIKTAKVGSGTTTTKNTNHIEWRGER